MNRFEQYIDQLDNSEMRKILVAMVSSSKENEKLFLNLCGKRISTDLDKVYADKVRRSWTRVCEDLEAYDEDDYGWFDYKADDNMDEDGNLLGDLNREVHDRIKALISILKEGAGTLPEALRKEIHDGCAAFIDTLHIEYWDSFTPELAQIMRLLCVSDEERRELLGELKDFDDPDTSGVITELYKDLGDETEAIVNKAMNSHRVDEILLALRTLDGKEEHERAFELACKCYEKDWVLSDDERSGARLGRYIIECFNNNLESISQFILSHKIGVKLLAELYDRYRDAGDYEMQKELMLRLVEAEDKDHTRGKGSTFWYSKMKEDLKQEDWKKERASLLKRNREHDYERFMYLTLADGDKEKVFKEIMHPAQEYPGVTQWWGNRNSYRWGLDDHFRFSFLIADDYPDQIYEYWWKRIDELVQKQGRENYRCAVNLLERIAEFSSRHRLKDDFKMRISDFAIRHKAKRLLIGMLREMKMLSIEK